jgi:Skp family chaperone for outer membrane proteins
MTFVPSRGLLAALALLVAAAAPLAAQHKVAYVDSRKILQEMPGRAQVEARIRTGLEALSARQKKMVDSLNAMMAKFQADSAKMTQEERVTRFTAIQRYDGEYRDTVQALEEEAQEAQNEALQPLFDQIRIALEDVRQADGLAMIFDIGAQVNPIVAMEKNLDVVERGIARLRPMPAARPQAQPGPTRPPAAAPAAGPVSQPTGVTRKP